MQKVIFLVDMNAFFISCEMSRNTALKDRPAAVAGDPKTRTGIILAANYEARAFGVKTTMLVHDALRLCPTISLVPPDHAFYEQKSQEVIAILSQFTPVLEQNSIDEAWLDMTGCEFLFGQPREAAQRIMLEINEKLGLWCSIGIAENKYLKCVNNDAVLLIGQPDDSIVICHPHALIWSALPAFGPTDVGLAAVDPNRDRSADRPCWQPDGHH